ncbi:hypothetical protein T484DRAFT_1809672 [Baffinella frigidus]|nr:hypothetical protein T484DRAFT_1809672 [Cryptophyta sp. CCMP2293]
MPLAASGGFQIPIRTLSGTHLKTIGNSPMELHSLPRIPYVNPTDDDIERMTVYAGIAARLSDLQFKESANLPGTADSAKDSVDEMHRVERLVAVKPRYETGYYDNTGCEPVGNERVTFKRRLARQRHDMSVKDMLVTLLPRADYEHLRQVNEDQATYAAMRHMMMADKELLIQQNNMLFFCTYNPDIGFRVSIDGANNLPVTKNIFPVAVFGAVPPCCYFGPTRLTLDTYMSSELDPNSTVRCPRWLDSYSDFKHVACHHGSRTALLIVGMERKRTKDGGYEVVRHEIGWTTMPLFMNQQLEYLWDGGYQLPVYAGAIPVSFPEAIDMFGVEGAQKHVEENLKVKLIPGIQFPSRIPDVHPPSVDVAALPEFLAPLSDSQCRHCICCSVFVRIQDMQRGQTSNPLMAQRVVPNKSNGIPPDCAMTFLENWTTEVPPRQRMSDSEKKKYMVVHKPTAGGLFGGGHKDKPIKTLIGSDISWFNWILELREDAEAITRVSGEASSNDEDPKGGILANMDRGK